MTIPRPAFLLLLALCSLGFSARAEQAPPPRLLVILVVDQFRADYLERFGPWLGNDGFRRLQREGTHFTNARYHHAITQTAAGHAQMSTGAFAERHGIIGNDWLDRTTWAMVNSVEDPTSPLVGVSAAELGPESALAPGKSGRSPRHLLIDTLADALKARDGKRCRVVSVSAKDRAAILLAGRRGDVALWQEAGRFISSRYYGPTLPSWVSEFNRTHRVADSFGTIWERLLPAAIYDKTQGPDDAAGEETGLGLGRTFPHAINGGEDKPGRRFLVAWENTPLAAAHLGQFAQQAITAERLGHHEGTDLLGLSFSSFDELGHRYGPDSHEIMDAFLRLDRVLAQVLDHLDREVGLDRCVIALTGDHGVAPLPERPAAPGASRLKLGTIDTRLRAALDARFGSGPAEGWFRRDNLAYHVTPAAARQVGDAARVSSAIVAALRAMPEIALALSAEELAAEPTSTDPLAAAVRRSWHADRRRDVLFFPHPFVVPREGTGTTHGTPWDYDTRVPLIFRGRGVPAGAVRTDDVGIENLAPTLAARAGLTMPQAQGRDLFRAP